MNDSPKAIIHSCTHCRRWVFDFNQTSEQRRRTCSERIPAILRDPHLRFSEAAQDSIHGISFFEATMDQVETAVIAGCQMAQQLTGSAYVEDNLTTIKQTWHKAGRFSAFAACLIDLNQCFFGVLQLDPCSKDGFRRQFHEFGGSSLVWEIMALGSGDPAARDLNQTLPNLTPDSDKSFTRVKSWMESCHRDHPSCSSQHEQAMPKRLIAISPNNLRLLETNAERQKYAALSYKWGGPQPVQATNASLSSLMNGFSIEDLPYSLRDAVALTRQLGLSYLWIDALCIIQDNESDKGTEVSRMATIYENAAVTIASSRTNSAMESFLSPRTEFNGRCFDDDSSHELFGFDYHCRDGQLGSIVLMHEYMPRLFDQEPLDTRAWAFQERLLSPRIIDYRSEQTKWMCRMSKGQTGFTDGWLNRSVGYRDHELLIQSQNTIHSLDHASKNGIHNARYEWYAILSLYTSRDITRKADRLPAISAVAQRYAEILEVEYMAGLWRPWIGEELLWKQKQNITGAVRPTEYQGPSWSWAGINAPIEIKMLSSSERWATVTSPDIEVRRFVDIPHMDNFQSGDVFKIVDSSIKLLVTDAEFGEVKSGAQLVIRGKLRSAMLSSDWNTAKKSWLTRTRVPTTPASRSWRSRLFDQNPSNIEILALDVYLDCAQDDFRKYGLIREFPHWPQMQVFLLSIGQYGKTHCGLILVQQSSRNYFRVGVFFSSFSRDLDDFPKDNDEQWEARKREQVLWLLSSNLQTISLV